ncbi:hypothetical protein [Halorussus halobius]|uniref:hypothetical protein n=1 Tax=Halorussus halobius TaxID=1710537 RepID=UPI00109329F3|nr:hypothetical protein [Halorussus halobius]
MAEVREDALDQIDSHESLLVNDFVRYVEEHHHDGPPGVDRDLLAAYAEAAAFDVDMSALDDDLVDSDEWVPGKKLYHLGEGRISTYPPSWHEAFDGLDDLLDLVATIETQVTESEGTQFEAVTEEGVPEVKLYRMARVAAGIDREAVQSRLDDLSDAGEITWDPTVRDPRIQLGEESR